MNGHLFSQLINFYSQTEKLKTILRHSSTSVTNRQESVADHSWHICLLALTLFPHLTIKIDQLHTLKLLIIHDLAETETGDIPAFKKNKSNQKQIKSDETKAIKKILSYITQPQQNQFFQLWQEFEDNQTPEAKLANAIDKLEAVIQHNISDISTWDQNDFDYHPYCRNKYFDFDPFMRQLKDHIDHWSMQKIEFANMIHHIAPKHLKTYQNKQHEPNS